MHERFLFQWSILPLLDNDATDEFVYEVHVYTGLKSNSGTDSKVSLIVAGTVSDSGIRKLEDGVREKPFESGGVTSFLMSTPDDLGIPATLKIWHDNSGEGKKAGWYCSKVVVVDVKKNEWCVTFHIGRS